MLELLETCGGDTDFEHMWLSYPEGNIIDEMTLRRLGKHLNEMLLGHLPNEHTKLSC